MIEADEDVVAISDAIRSVGRMITSHDAMGVTAGLCNIAEAIDRLAAAVENKE